MTDELPYYFRIDYRSTIKNGRVNERSRVHVYDVERWEELIESIMIGDAVNPDTEELILFKNIIKIEKVNKGVKL